MLTDANNYENYMWTSAKQMWITWRQNRYVRVIVN